MRKRRILLIDDEITFTQLLKINLEESGRYEVRVENQGTQGLASAREFQPDLILLDVIMPDTDGGEVAAQLEADDILKRIPVVYVTAVVSKGEVRDHRGKIGGRSFVAKPVSVEEIMACIEHSVGHGGEVLDGVA